MLFVDFAALLWYIVYIRTVMSVLSKTMFKILTIEGSNCVKKCVLKLLIITALCLAICSVSAFAANTVTIADNGISLDVYKDANGSADENYVKVTVTYSATPDEAAEEMSRITFVLSATTVEDKLKGNESKVVYLDEAVTPTEDSTYSFVIEKARIKSAIGEEAEIEGASLLFKMGGVGVENAAACEVVYSTPVVYGDVNGDGRVSIGDATLILQYVARKITFTAEQKAAADVTRDGKVSMGDATKMLQYIAGKITEL